MVKASDMGQPVLLRPKSLFVEAVVIAADGSERVYQMKFERVDDDSELTVSMDQRIVDGIDPTGTYRIPEPTGVHDFAVSFNGCRAGTVERSLTEVSDLGTLREVFTRAGIKTRVDTGEDRLVLHVGNEDSYTISGPVAFPCGSVDFTFDVHGALLSGAAFE